MHFLQYVVPAQLSEQVIACLVSKTPASMLENFV